MTNVGVTSLSQRPARSGHSPGTLSPRCSFLKPDPYGVVRHDREGEGSLSRRSQKSGMKWVFLSDGCVQFTKFGPYTGYGTYFELVRNRIGNTRVN